MLLQNLLVISFAVKNSVDFHVESMNLVEHQIRLLYQKAIALFSEMLVTRSSATVWEFAQAFDCVEQTIDHSDGCGRRIARDELTDLEKVTLSPSQDPDAVFHAWSRSRIASTLTP